jgi:hypothetical protein
MKHASADALDQLEPLLAKVRRFDGLKEKSRGVFYFRAKPTLHFHEDPAGFFADFRPADHWQRLKVNTKAERTALLRAVADLVSTD